MSLTLVSQNDIRPVAVGKKNWLFTGSERAGKHAAAIQSLLYTAKLNGLDPAAWLRDTLEKLPACPNSQIDSLLPLRTSEFVKESKTQARDNRISLFPKTTFPRLCADLGFFHNLSALQH